MQRNNLFLLRFLVILNLMFLVQSYPSQAASPEKRVALVIGNSAYQNTPSLANPRNDATEMGKVLKRIGFDVDVVVDATKPQMDQALRRFGNNLAGAIAAVFYYAGHGIQVDGINYILPVDATLSTERDLSWEVSDLTTVLKQMEGHNRVNLLFLDACRDNPLSQTLARSMGESRSSVIGRGLAPMKANAGTLISYSTKEGEVAADGKGKHSPYTEALLKHIEVPGVEIGLMLRKVREEVIAATKNKQVPWEYGSLLGEFYFTGPVTIQVQPKVYNSATGSKNESLYWEFIMNENDPAAYEDYIKNYPDGVFVELAKRKINALKKGGAKPSVVDVIPQSDRTKPSGSLKISSEPTDALVLLDGDPMGNTDMEMSGIDIGKKKLELKKDCFETKTTEVFIKANQQVILNLKLKPSCGAISVTSNPAGADILMNEKLMGVTPAELAELKDGTYTISLKKEGYEDWKDTATVKAGKTVLIKADRLKPAVMAKPPSQQPLTEINPPVAEQKTSDIHFAVGATDSLPVKPSGISTGNQQTTVKKDAYPDHGETVAVQTGKTTSTTASLKPLSKYTKLDSNGKQLPDSAQSWLMVLDNETNLIWEVKQNKDGVMDYKNPNDADNTYLTFECDKKFLKALNGANWGGFSDWRLPSEEELKTLVDFNGRKPTINTAYFPNTQSSYYRSSTTNRWDWSKLVDFGNGSLYSSGDSRYVRAVRGGQ
jgi:hypothetical protein